MMKMEANSKKEAPVRDKDVRVIVLTKALELNTRAIEANGDNTLLISLGYFDSIQFENMEEAYAGMCAEHGMQPHTEKSWLSKAWEHSVVLSEKYGNDNEAMVYHHPLYVMAYNHETEVGKRRAWEEKIDAFWEADSFFQFVTFVHFFKDDGEASQESNEAVRFREVEAEVTRILQAPCNEEDSADDIPKVQCYQSIDLSDMVVIWKTNHLPHALKRIETLYKASAVGDLHTICSFRRRSDAQESAKCFAGTIPYTSFRFGIRYYAQVELLDKALAKKCPKWGELEKYNALGTEDMNVIGRDIPVRDLIKIISLWFEDEEINALFRKAFNDSSTHIGTLKKGTDVSGRMTEADTSLVEKCKDIAQQFSEARKRLDWKQTDLSYSWVKAISEQLKTLVSMSRLCVLDGFCYIMLQSIEKFCARAALLFEKDREISPEELKSVHKFIRSWSVLMEQAVRADGQFIANPGINTTLYHVPIRVMECDMAFIYTCMSFIRDTEDGENLKEEPCALFLMPRLCRRVKVDALLGEDSKEELLYIEVPLDYLYDQETLLPQLCHEISHYIGESPRCRDVRSEAYLWCSAALVAFYCGYYTKAATEEIFRDLKRKTGFDTPEGKENMRYMQEMKKHILRAVMECLNDSETILSWEQALKMDGNPTAAIDVGGVESDKFGDAFDFVGELLRECYADICMIYLLQLSCEKYLNFYRRELAHAPEPIKIILEQRAALTIIVVWGKLDMLLSDEEDNLWKAFYMGTETIIENIVAEEPLHWTLPVEILVKISEYLKECYRTIEEKMGSPKFQAGRETIRGLYNALASKGDLADESLYRAIQKYERIVLGQAELSNGITD